LGRKICGGRTSKFLLFVFSTHKNLHNDVGLEGKINSTQEQAALTALINVVKELCNYLLCDFLFCQ